MKSYAQNYEDLILWNALGEVVREGFYIDVGAGHPSNFSVTRKFYDAGWRGINVEPGQTDYKLLSEKRPRDINLNVAAGDLNGIATFDVYPSLNDSLSTPEPGLRARLANWGHTPQPETCVVLTLDTIIEEYAPEEIIHFLKIDVEGYEENVLKGLDLDKHSPWVMVIEATEPHTQVRSDQRWNRLLFDHGYTEVYFDDLNCYYLHPNMGFLKEDLRLPDNV